MIKSVKMIVIPVKIVFNRFQIMTSKGIDAIEL